MSERTFPIPPDDLAFASGALYEEVMDLAILGAGMAGLAAGVYAVNRGLSAARIGSTGGIAYTTGYLDIMAAPGNACAPHAADFREAFAALRRENPEHPYCKVTEEDTTAALAEFMELLAAAGLPYAATGKNLQALSPVGTVKNTYAVPVTMMAGVTALQKRTPCLLVDFAGLKAFSARGIAAALKKIWPDITPVTVPFPELQWAGELYPEAMALSLEVPAAREALAANILPHMGNAKCVGLPAVLGIYDCTAVQEHMSSLLGVPVFEIPTSPPGVPGIRLRENLDEAMRGRGMTLFAQRYAFAVRKQDGLFHVDVGETAPERTLRARALVLATGRFLSGGLVADRVDGIREPLMNLPVAAPASREEWHREDLFDPAGHPVNKAGLRVDADFRVLGEGGEIVDPSLYAIGAILAGQDWVREKSGAGIALASAWKAINAIVRQKKECV